MTMKVLVRSSNRSMLKKRDRSDGHLNVSEREGLLPSFCVISPKSW